MGSVVLTGATSGSTTITPSDTVTVTVTLPSTGGTLQTSGAGFTTNGVAYASSTSALATGSALTFDGSNLGIGVTPSSWGSIFKVVQGGGFGGCIAFQTSGPSTKVGNNWYYDGTNYVYTTTNASSRYDLGSGQHLWYTAPSGTAGNAISFTQAMSLDNNGRLLIGLTSPLFSLNCKLQVYKADGAGDAAIGVGNNSGASTTTMMVFLNGNGTVGTIQTSGSNTSYNTSSDYRLKENIAPMTGALNVVQQLKPVTYNWKVDGSASQGFIAHELQAVVPDCVTGEKDAVDADGKPQYQGIDTSFLVATLTSALQELSTLITAQQSTIQSLTERITALEGART